MPKKVDHEHNHQSAAVTWAKLNTYKYPELALLYSVPNAGHGGKNKARQAVYFKAEGLKPGQPDLTLPAARRGFHSLYIETKVPKTPFSEKTYPSKIQKECMGELADAGNLVVVCWGATAIEEVLEFYLTDGTPLSDWRSREFTIEYLNKLKNVEVRNEES